MSQKRAIVDILLYTHCSILVFQQKYNAWSLNVCGQFLFSVV